MKEASQNTITVAPSHVMLGVIGTECWKVHVQASKIFQMKSNGCRDVQHTGLQSTQTRRNYSSNNTGKQGAQTRGHITCIFPSIPTSVATLHV